MTKKNIDISNLEKIEGVSRASHPDILDPEIFDNPEKMPTPVTTEKEQTEIIFNMKSPSDYDSMRNYTTRFAKSEMGDLLRPLLKALAGRKVGFTKNSDPAMVSLFGGVLRRGHMEKMRSSELAGIYTSFCGDPENIFPLMEFVPGLKTLYADAVKTTDITRDDAKEILGRYPIIRATNDWSMRILPEAMLSLFSLWVPGNGYYVPTKELETRATLFLASNTRRILATRLLGPDVLDPKLSPALPDNEKLEIYDSLNALPDAFAYVSGCYTGGELLTPKGAISLKRIEKVGSKLTGIPTQKNLLPDETPFDVLLVLAIATFLRDTDKKYIDKDLKTFSKYILHGLAKGLDNLSALIMIPQLTGLTPPIWDGNRAEKITALLDKLIKVKEDEWLDISDLRLRFMCNDNIIHGGAMYTALVQPDRAQSSALKKREDGGKVTYSWEREPINLWDDLTWPFLKNWLRLLCATGLIELAVDPKGTDVMDGMRWLRLTPVGRYAFDVAPAFPDDFIRPVDRKIELDENQTIITLLNPDSPYKHFLKQTAKALSSTRFLVTVQSLMKGCYDSAEVTKRLETLQAITGDEVPDNWQQLFDTVERRSDCRLGVGSQYILMRLNLKIEGLAEFAMSDPTVRKNTLRAQEGYLLVKADASEEVFKSFRDNGFMV